MRRPTIVTIEVRREYEPKYLSFRILSTPGIRKATAWYNEHIRVTRPPIRGQVPPKLPTVVLMTEDAANRGMAEKAGLSTVSGKSSVFSFFPGSDRCPPQVRRYVEGVKDPSQLLDLLAAGSDHIEPTRAAGSRQALYPDVSYKSLSIIMRLNTL